MNSFVTLFDTNYLVKGLAMYYSLRRVHENFDLYVITFDQETYVILKKLNLPHLIPVSLEEFEDDRLKEIKTTRSAGEYCWTCSCFSIKYVLEKYEPEQITYLDADLFFYDTTHRIYDEFYSSGKSVLITSHDFSDINRSLEIYGKYCVQFMVFKNDPKGRKVLNWWCDRCEEWCYNRLEDGKFGDQKYLDDWLERFDCVHVLENTSLCAAPWNIQKYKTSSGPHFDGIKPVFYHFHELKWIDQDVFYLCRHKLSRNNIQYVYIPYVKTLQHILEGVRDRWDPSFEKGIAGFPPSKLHIKESLLHPMGFIKSRKIVKHLTGTYNLIHLH